MELFSSSNHNWDFTGGSGSEESACNAGGLGSMQEIWVQSLSMEDPLEKRIATTHSSILACRIPWTGEHGGL